MGRLDQFNIIASFNESWYSRMMENFKNEPYVKDNIFVYNHVYNTIHVDDEHFDEVKKYNLDFIQYCFDRRDFFNVIEKTAIPADFDLPFNSVKYYADNFKNKLDGIPDLNIFINELEQFCIVVKNKFISLKVEGLKSYQESVIEDMLSFENDKYIPTEIIINATQETQYKNFVDSFSEMFIEYFKGHFQNQIFYYEKYYGSSHLSFKKQSASKSLLNDDEIYDKACKLKIFNSNTLSFNDYIKHSNILISGSEFLNLLFTNQNKISKMRLTFNIDPSDKTIFYKFLHSFKQYGFDFNGSAFFKNATFNCFDSNAIAVNISSGNFNQIKIDQPFDHTIPDITKLIMMRKRG